MTEFVAGLLGAVVGAIATGGVTYWIAPRIGARVRKRERSEQAVERILEVLETDHWDRLNHIRELHELRADVRAGLGSSASDEDTEAAVIIRNEATDLLSAEVSELTASARRLRLFASRVDDEAFRDRFGTYLIAILQFDASCRVASKRTEPSDKASAHVPDPDTAVRVPLRGLLSDGNRFLGFEWWDPDDVTRYLPDSEGEGP
jgi:hypothetical protein